MQEMYGKQGEKLRMRVVNFLHLAQIWNKFGFCLLCAFICYPAPLNEGSS